MQNYVQPGKKLTLTAPTGGTTSGNGYLIGALFVVAACTVGGSESFAGATVGVFTLAKTTGEAWTEGQKIYWDDTAKKTTTTSTSNKFIGHATAAAGSGDTTGDVRLHGATT